MTLGGITSAHEEALCKKNNNRLLFVFIVLLNSPLRHPVSYFGGREGHDNKDKLFKD